MSPIKKVLITGGAGFIGSHLADELLAAGYHVRVLDNLSEQVHGSTETPPDYLNPEVEFLRGDVRDADAVARALDGMDAVYHLAAAVGVGQSMYEIAAYTSVNNLGTAVLLEGLMRNPVERLVVASSMSIYGEGLYRDLQGRPQNVGERTLSQLRRGQWGHRAADGSLLVPVPTPETKTPVATSVYALSKFDQERLCLITGSAYQIPTVALRFFNVYGPRQALSNPYTGVLAIFASRYLNNQPPLVYEDGLQQRDFVNVHDVARACRLAMETESAAGEVFNIGSGRPLTIRDVASEMAVALDCTHINAQISNKYRVGDIRDCFADISKAKTGLNYQPQVTFRDGLAELGQWLEGQVATDRTARASDELISRGLMV